MIVRELDEKGIRWADSGREMRWVVDLVANEKGSGTTTEIFFESNRHIQEEGEGARERVRVGAEE